MSEPVTVVIADDHPMIRQGLRLTLDGLPGIEVVGEATTGQQAVDLGDSLQPDVLIMDINMPELNGIDATRALTPVQPARQRAHLDHVRRRRLGLPGHAGRGARLPAQRRRRAGNRAGRPRRGGRRSHLRARDRATGPGLPHRHRAAAAAGGLPRTVRTRTRRADSARRGPQQPDIARQLYLSPKTVRNHVSNIFTKLQVADRAQAIIKARDAGLGTAAERAT